MKPVDSTQEHSRRELFDHARNRTTRMPSKRPPRRRRGITMHRGATHMRESGQTASERSRPRLCRHLHRPQSSLLIASVSAPGQTISPSSTPFQATMRSASRSGSISSSTRSGINDSDCDTSDRGIGLHHPQSSRWHSSGRTTSNRILRGMSGCQPYYEVERATMLRAVWSKRQLLEVLTDFWHNHFNVYGPDSWAAPVWSHWDRVVIRGNALGNFRTMLGRGGATSRHALLPRQLHILERRTQRELGSRTLRAAHPRRRPLHGRHASRARSRRVRAVCRSPMSTTMSSKPPGVSPVGPSTSIPGSSTTGPIGTTVFQKNVLGTYIDDHQPALFDGNTVLDVVASHPGTARHISTKLAHRLIGDNPDPAVIDAAAAVFEAEASAPDQLAQVVRTIVLHPSLSHDLGRQDQAAVGNPVERGPGRRRQVLLRH